MALPPRARRGLALACLVGLSAFVVLVLALHVLEPGVAGLQHTLSEFALGRFGLLMVVAFLAASVGSLALSYALLRGGQVAAAILLGLWGLGLLVSAFVPTDPYGTTDATATTAGTVHNLVGGLSFLVCGAGLIVLGARTRSWIILAAGIVGLASVVTLFLPIDIPEGGLQRAMILAFVAGLLVAAARLRQDALAPRAPTATRAEAAQEKA